MVCPFIIVIPAKQTVREYRRCEERSDEAIYIYSKYN